MKRKTSVFTDSSNRRRGSVYVIVVAGLAMLGLVTLTLSYTAQMEEQASRNWSEGMQARISAISGMPNFANGPGADSLPPGFEVANLGVDPRAPKLSDTSTSPSGPGEVAQETPAGLAHSLSQIGLGRSSGQAPRGRELGKARRLFSPGRFNPIDVSSLIKSNLAYHLIEDEAAKINVNTVLDTVVNPEEFDINLMEYTGDGGLPDPTHALTVYQLGEFIDAVLEANGIEHRSGVDLARELVRYRYGPDREPGEADVDDNLNGPETEAWAEVPSSGTNRIVANPHSPLIVPLNADGRDNNRDGQIDEPDESIENDGRDNDHDGEVDEVGEAIDEPAEFKPDMRLMPAGDDRPFGRIENLNQVPGFTPEIVESLRPFLTVFSVSRSGSMIHRLGQSPIGIISIDPNTATVEECFAVLRATYPDHPEELAAQFAVNIIDRRDRDNLPTEVVLGSLGETYMGLEVTPYINEVCPDVATFAEDGDDGQFIELFNPYTQDFDLTGWRIETGSSTVYLRGLLPGGGYLVITDDYDDSNDPEPEEEPGFGSLYDVFGVVSTGLDRLIQEQESFDLIDRQAVIKLYDNQDSIVDSFSYVNGQFNGANMSFQRVDPRVRHTVHDLATPLDENPGYIEPSLADEAGLALFEALHNEPFRTPLEMMLVSSSFAPAGADSPGAPGWRFPSTRAGVLDNFDLAIVDLFYPDSPPPSRTPDVRPGDQGRGEDHEGGRGPGSAAARGTIQTLMAKLSRPQPLHGRINLNTASPAVLSSLPGMDVEFVRLLASLRDETLELGDDFPEITLLNESEGTEGEAPEAQDEEPVDLSDTPEGEVVILDEYGFAALGFGSARELEETEEPSPGELSGIDGWYLSRSPQGENRWNSLSDFIRDRKLWGDATLIERLEKLYLFSGMITFQSLSYRVLTSNIPETKTDDQKRSSVIYTERILAGDGDSIETVIFGFGHRVGRYR